MTDSIFAFLEQAFGFIAKIDYTATMLFALIIVLGTVVYKLHKSEKSKFFFDNLFLDSDGSASSSKLALLIALIVSSWGFIHLTLSKMLTEWYFIGYIGAWVLNRGINKFTELKEAVKVTK